MLQEGMPFLQCSQDLSDSAPKCAYLSPKWSSKQLQRFHVAHIRGRQFAGGGAIEIQERHDKKLLQRLYQRQLSKVNSIGLPG